MFFSGAIGAFLTYRSTDPQTTAVRKIIMAVLRFVAISAIVFMLADPLLLSHHRKEVNPSIALLVDDSESMSISDRIGNRAEIVSKILASSAMKQLEDKYLTHLFLFAESLYCSGEMKFSGVSTALGEALSEVLDTASALELGAVVLLSDGQSNIDIDPLSVASSYPMPIYTIGIGDPKPAPDITVAQVIANPNAYANEEVPVIAHIRAWRVGGKRTTVSLWEGSKKIAEQQIELPQSGQTVPVRFEIIPTEAGTHYYTVRVPKIANEISSSNNAQSVAVKVFPSKKRILVACDHPSWEVSFWRRALETDPHIEIELFVNKGGSTTRFSRFPTDTAMLNRYDALVLIHAAPILTANTADAIANYVQNGGSILWLMDDGSLSSRAQNIMNRLLPVKIATGAKFVADQFTPSVGADGFAHPVLKITRTGEELSSAIAGMPPLLGFVPTSPKADAEVLLTHPENGYPVLAVGEFGSGRTAVLCAAPLWRWAILPAAFGQDNHIFNNLAANIMQFLLAKEKIAPFVLRTGKRIYRSGEPVAISASLSDQSNQPLSGAKVTVKLKKQNGDSTETFSVELGETGNGIYETQLPSLSPGKFKISAVATYNGKVIGRAQTSMVVEEYQLEFAQTNQDRAMLEAISELSGGKYFFADSIGELSDDIELPVRLRSWTVEKELWSSPWLLLLVVVSLASEWLLRKRANLL